MVLGPVVLGGRVGLGRFVVGLGELGPAVGGFPVGGAPRLKVTVPMGGSPSATNFFAINSNLKTVPFDIWLFQGLFFMVYTLLSWLSTISARHISKFGVGSGNDNVMVHPSVTSSVIFSSILPLKPPYQLSTILVSLCSPTVTGKQWSKRMYSGTAEKIHDMLKNIFLENMRNSKQET